MINSNLPATRSEASASGSALYFTGVKCKRGHLAARYTAGGDCVTCKSIRASTYSSANKDKKALAHKKRYEANKQKILEYGRAWYLANKDSVAARIKQHRELCKDEVKERNKLWYEKNKTEILARQKKYREDNKELIAKRTKRRRQQNESQYKAAVKRHYEKHKHQYVRRDAERRARKFNATPKWFSEFDEFVISEAFALAKQREFVTGFCWHVDHMIPLSAKRACGLHVGLNVQVIPNSINLSKNNKMVLTERGQWIMSI